MKYFLIAGERSGDLHASYLIKAIRRHDPEAVLIGYGGDLMKGAGMQLLSHYEAGAFMGFIEVLFNIRSIFSRMKQCKQDILTFRPDVLILIDYPGFNLRMAAFAKKQGIKTSYYISPKIWAWKESRIKSIKRNVDQMLVIFPFEVPYYQGLGYEVTYVGNPLVEQISAHQHKQIDVTTTGYKKTVAFLPGSRRQEVEKSMEMIRRLASSKGEWMFLVAAVDNLDETTYASLVAFDNIQVLTNRTYDLLLASDVAVVTSGTATLETALLNIPQVVCYRANAISYAVGKHLVKIKFISLVNLVAEREVVKELIQDDYNEKNLLEELDRIMNDGSYLKEMKLGYKNIRTRLGTKESSQEAAKKIIDWVG